MKIVIKRENLLEGLQFAAGVVERRQSLPVLANVLLHVSGDHLAIIGSDMEIELTTRVELLEVQQPGSITVSGRKFLDICRALPGGVDVVVYANEGKLVISAGKSRFSLATLPADDFPIAKAESASQNLMLRQSDFLQLLESTYFAMAHQDVRYYLNGMLFEFVDGAFNAVATDGHRLAFRSMPFVENKLTAQFIVPRKGVLELLRLLDKESSEVLNVHYHANSLRVETSRFVFVSRLIDGRFPDYHRVIPKKGDKVVSVDRDELRQMLQRAAILTNEKYHAIRLQVQPGLLSINATNMEYEEAHDELPIDYSGATMEVGFNVDYLMDVLTVMPAGLVKIILSNPDTGVLIESEALLGAAFVIMPMSL